MVNAQNQTWTQSSIATIHEMSQTSLNDASAMNVFRILGGESSQNICCSANVHTHTLSTRLLTIKAGKDAVCGGLSASERGNVQWWSDFMRLIYGSTTKAGVPFNFEGRVKACAWRNKLSDWRHHRHTLLFCSRHFSCISRAIEAVRLNGVERHMVDWVSDIVPQLPNQKMH